MFARLQVALATIAVALSIAAPALAELPPSAYDELRARSQEALIVRIERVRTAALSGGGMAVEAEADVIAVQRSRTGLIKGARVTIRYAITPRRVPGPSEPPLIKAGEFYPAFLNRADGGPVFSGMGSRMVTTYQPGAYGASFNMTPLGIPADVIPGSGDVPIPPAPAPEGPR